MKPTYWVYIIECSDKSLYTGIAKNVQRRLVVHNRGKGAKYTRSRLPVRLLFQHSFPSKGEALKAELYVKAMSHQQKQRLINLYIRKTIAEPWIGEIGEHN
jgi:predicted GIY-YIG superfamily endonuclease